MKRKILFSSGIIGIILMLIGQFSFSINDVIVKLSVNELNSKFSTFNVLFIRGIITTFLIFIYLKIIERKKILKILTIKNYHKRGIYEVLTALFFFIGLITLPVATVYTLLMTNPLFVTLFAYFFLKEKVGIRRWGAVVIGFVGVVFVINPADINFSFLFIFPIIAAIFLTIRDIATKKIITKSNNFEIIFITSILVTLFSGFISLFIDFEITINQLPYLFISGFFLTIGYLCAAMTIYYAPLSLTASSRYSVIIFGIIFGYIILNEIPNINMLIGAIIITASGIFVIKREKELGKIK
mgnify:CR=1 FL=1|tara:strand:+ start:3429 stop:4322 length:894 start_codon:yes stop_codon:yes gene_type:complete